MSNGSSLYLTRLTGKKIIFNNMSKIIELKLISTTSHRQRTLTNDVTHQHISGL